MKKVTIFLIHIYQIVFSPLLHAFVGAGNACRYSVSCSEYTKRAVIQYGVIKGLRLGLLRFLSCQPFGTIQQQ